MHKSLYLLLIGTVAAPLFCADAPTVKLTKIIKPFAHIQMHHNGITIPMLGLVIDVAYAKRARFIRIECMTEDSDAFNALQTPRPLIWSGDPRKDELMPELQHHATGSQLFTKLFFDSPAHSDLDYQVESFNESDGSHVAFNCIVHPNQSTARECRIICENSLDISGDFNNKTFSRIHTLGIKAERIIGRNVLDTLLAKLPYLQNFSIMETKLEDTTLSLTHKELIHCEFLRTNLKKVALLKTPLLRRLLLTDNQIDSFNTAAFGLQSFKLVFGKTGFIEKTVPYQPDWVKPLYIDLRKNPLKAEDITVAGTQPLHDDNQEKNT